MQVDREQRNTPYGVNIETIHFYGSGGSQLIFSLFKREDSNTLEQAAQFVYQHERSLLYAPEDILYSAKDGTARIIVTGFSDAQEQLDVYDMTKVDGQYAMQMFACYPGGRNGQEEKEMSYVVECLYRMCGFSGSSSQAVDEEEAA